MICEHLGKEEVIAGKTGIQSFFPLSLFPSRLLYQGNAIYVRSPLKQLTCTVLVDGMEINITQRKIFVGSDFSTVLFRTFMNDLAKAIGEIHVEMGEHPKTEGERICCMTLTKNQYIVASTYLK